MLKRIEDSGTSRAQFDRMQQNCQALVSINIASQIARDLIAITCDKEGEVSSRAFDPNKEKTQFDLDLLRGYHIFMPDGEQIPADMHVARDKFVQFITGNSLATFDTADTTTKVKAHILMTCMNQSISGIATSSG